jgi:hypothetical protein
MVSHQPESGIESPYAWRRLLASLAISTIGGIGLWSVVVVLPMVQAEFKVDRADASLPYTATMVGFSVGAIFMGRLADRKGIVWPLTIGAIMLSIGYIAASHATSLWQFILAQGLLIGMAGSSATFAPLIADVSHWFTRNRGIALIDLRQRQLPRRHDLAAADPASGAKPGLAFGDALCRAVLRRLDAAADPVPAPPLAGRPCRDDRPRRRRPGAADDGVAGDAAGDPGLRRHRLLRRHVDAAGAYRRLLRRPGLRPGARGRDAVADAGARHHQPAGLRLDRRPHRRRAHAAARLGAAMPGAAALFALRRADVALHRLGPVRPVPGRHRAGLRHHRARIFPRARGRRPHRLRHHGDDVGMALGGWMSGAIFD